MITQDAISQWVKIFDFGGKVGTVYFRDYTETPEDGFVGNAGRDDQLWRTLDGGVTWQKISYPPYAPFSYTIPMCFTFKDRYVGWFCGFASWSVLKTIDGGNTWSLTGNGVDLVGSTSVHYVQSSGMLVVSDLGVPYKYSTDEGATYQLGIYPGFEGGVGGAFTGDYGILSSTINSAPLREYLLYTKDGGLTWDHSELFAEFFQPVGITGTATFFVLSEFGKNTGNLVRSDDGGETWKFLSRATSPNTLYPVTGTIQYGSEMRLFYQTTLDAAEGIKMSEDTGYTFYTICGPTNDQDTRFYVRDTFIYAGDRYGGLWLNTTGIGSNSKPILSTDSIVFRALSCTGEERILTFTFFDSCNNRQARLLTSSIIGNSVFSILKGGEARTIHPDDSITILYIQDSASRGNDSGALHLQFKLGWKTFDTTISLLGIGNIVPDSLEFIPSLANNNIPSGQIAEYILTPSKAVNGKNLSEIAFDVTIDADLVEPRDFTTEIDGVSVATSSTQLPNGVVSYHVRVTGSDMALIPQQAVVRIPLLTYVTDTVSTAISLSNIRLNGFDPDYERCVLSATSRDTTFTLALLCGDKTIKDFMRHGRSALEITSIRPNPARDEVVVEFVSEADEPVRIEIYDAVGKQVHSEQVEKAEALVIPVRALSAGSYVVRVVQGGEAATGSFVVER